MKTQSIIPADVAAELRGNNPAATASEAAQRRMEERKSKDAERKRNDRAKAKEDKARQAEIKKASEASTFPEYWQKARTTLTVEQRAEFEARESNILDLQYAMEKYVDN